MATYEDAKKTPDAVLRKLEALSPRAAASLKESFEETLTIHHLEIPRSGGLAAAEPGPACVGREAGSAWATTLLLAHHLPTKMVSQWLAASRDGAGGGNAPQ